MKKILIISLTLCFLLSAIAFANLPNKDIVPGKSVGGLKLGTSVKGIKSLMGEPDKTQKGEGSQKYFIYNYDKDKEREYGLMLTIENDKLVSIFVFDKGFIAPGGLKVGESYKKAKEKYKDQIKKGYYIQAPNNLNGYDVIFPRIGIGFMYKHDDNAGDDLITNIMILEPIPDWTKE
jgi:hypothetical protein